MSTVTSDLVNRRLSGAYRATALSALSVAERLVVAPLIPLLAGRAAAGRFADGYALLAGVLATVLCGAALVQFRSRSLTAGASAGPQNP